MNRDACQALVDRMVNDRLPDHLKAIAISLREVAQDALDTAPDDIDTFMGIHNLVTAKDCLIRAKVSNEKA